MQLVLVCWRIVTVLSHIVDALIIFTGRYWIILDLCVLICDILWWSMVLFRLLPMHLTISHSILTNFAVIRVTQRLLRHLLLIFKFFLLFQKLWFTKSTSILRYIVNLLLLLVLENLCCLRNLILQVVFVLPRNLKVRLWILTRWSLHIVQTTSCCRFRVRIAAVLQLIWLHLHFLRHKTILLWVLSRAISLVILKATTTLFSRWFTNWRQNYLLSHLNNVVSILRLILFVGWRLLLWQALSCHYLSRTSTLFNHEARPVFTRLSCLW